MRKSKFIAIIISIILVSVVVIPIAINESYKHGVVYVTKWDAADVLSFYGTLLGAATTAITLIGTIQFTRKQIQRNQFLEDNRRKWEKVESIITQALIDVSPLKILNGCEMDMNISPIANLHVIISKLQSYAATAKTSLDMISCYIDPVEYTYVASYVKELHNAIKQFCETSFDNEYINSIVNKGMKLIDVITSIVKDIGEKIDIDNSKKVVVDKYLKSHKIVIYIDDLDRAWEGTAGNIRRIAALLNAVRDLTNESSCLHFRISLRSDVYFLVRTADESTDKIEGNVQCYKDK